DAIVNNQSIDSNSIDQYATGESNDAGRGADVLPVYTVLDIDVAPLTVCTLAGQDAGDFGTYNKLSVRRFLRLSVPADGNYQFVASGPSDGDPDIVLHSGGFITAFEAFGQTETSPSVSMTAGSYVVEVYEFSNLTDSPRGDTCIDVSVQSL
ncbi:MAG: hypothetical protein HKM98_07725, partial [Gammaproteobacteria bacterium]|nr:hypothetical protein [Gammaproteobacteria bacterium]